MTQKRMSASDFRRDIDGVAKASTKKSWSNATPTDCPCGRKHASKMEARVCVRLRAEVEASEIPGIMLFQQARIPLWAIAPDDTNIPLYLNVDFVIVCAGRVIRYIDAKSKRRRSRDWRRGAAALAATWPYIAVEEVDK